MVVGDPRDHVLPSGVTISVVSPALFIATKLEAFRGRGRGDYYGSRDFGDVVTILDGREECVRDIHGAPAEVREFVVAQLQTLLNDPRFEDGIHGALRSDGASQARAGSVVLPRARAIAGS